MMIVKLIRDRRSLSLRRPAGDGGRDLRSRIDRPVIKQDESNPMGASGAGY